MNNLPDNLKYAETHEWSQLENDSLVRVGITDFAQEELGDLVFIELPEVGRKINAGDQCAVVESVKTASDLYSPVTGTITEVNAAVLETPELVNDEPYVTWLFCVQADNVSELNDLMDATAYRLMTEQ